MPPRHDEAAENEWLSLTESGVYVDIFGHEVVQHLCVHTYTTSSDATRRMHTILRTCLLIGFKQRET